MSLVRTLAALLVAASPLASQEKAEATLYTRVDGDVVRAAIEIEIEPGWHLYHGPTQADLGHPDAVGSPTTVELGGEGIVWSAVRFPEPIEIDQSVFGPGVYINAHEDELVLYAAGRLPAPPAGSAEPAVDAKAIDAKITGLVCEQSCIPYRETVESSGRGPDALFDDFPADLTAPARAGEPVAAPDVPGPEPPAPTRDEVRSGHADTTLYTRVVDGEVRAALRIAIEKGWHLYHGPTKADLGHPEAIGRPTAIRLHGGGVTWGAPRFPEPEKIDQSFVAEGAFILGHEGTIVLYARGEASEPGGEGGALGSGVWGEVEGQTCTDELCVDYDEVFVDQGRGPDALWDGYAAALGGTDDAAREGGAGQEGDEEQPEGLLLFLLAAIGGGLFALAMPCTYPMIPITISFFTKQAEARGGNVLPLALAYGAGIVLIFIVVGAVFGSVIIPFATHPVTNLVIGLAFLYFALVLFGLIDLQPPRFLMNAAGQASQKGGFGGVFLMGTLLVVTSFTCTAPFVGTILGLGAAGGLGRIVIGMGVFGLTMAIPFVFLSLVPGRIRAMPRSGEWMNTLKVTLGFVEVAASLKFFSNSDLVWGWNLLSRELFLLLWGVIFIAASLFLFGILRFKPGRVERGPKRLAAAFFFALLSAYSFWGMSGKKLDLVMTAIAPNYSGGVLGWEWYSPGGSWTIVKDDYEGALEQARREGKLLLVNFTGFT